MTQVNEWLTVESLDLEAQGVARNEEGKVVFIEGALPGEQVQVQVGRRKNAWEQATMTATSASWGDMADSGMVGSFKRLAADY